MQWKGSRATKLCFGLREHGPEAFLHAAKELREDKAIALAAIVGAKVDPASASPEAAKVTMDKIGTNVVTAGSMLKVAMETVDGVRPKVDGQLFD